MSQTRIFTSRGFDRFVQRERLSDGVLLTAVEQLEKGHIDADLGGGVFKQRIARLGSGKSGSYRTVIVFRQGDRAVFIEGFSKSDRSTHAPDELRALREAAREFLKLSTAEIERVLESGRLREIERR